MLELILVVAAIVLMVRIADAEGRSGIIWGAVTFGICMAPCAIPLPFIRIAIAAPLSYGIMFSIKLATE